MMVEQVRRGFIYPGCWGEWNEPLSHVSALGDAIGHGEILKRFFLGIWKEEKKLNKVISNDTLTLVSLKRLFRSRANGSQCSRMMVEQVRRGFIYPGCSGGVRSSMGVFQPGCG
jgi:hypothetical protein